MKSNGTYSRRQILGTGAALAAAVTFPAPGAFAKSDDPIKIGIIDPQTGPYAGIGKGEFDGAQLAIEQLNAKGGILGRPLQLFMEDGAGNPGVAVQKAHKLIDRENVSFLTGGVSSAVALSLSQTANERKIIYIDSGGHTDAVTGSDCKWGTFRTCMSTWMLASGNSKAIFDKLGKNWYFITPDYAFGHSIQAAYAKQLAKYGGKVLGNELAPLGTTDFSALLIKAKAAKPDVLMLLPAGDDLVNVIKQSVQFGLDKQMHIAGGLMELEVVRALPNSARVGLWTFEWYWNQPGVPADTKKHIDEFVATYRKKFADTPSARSWFGLASVYAMALGIEKAKTLELPKVARAIEGLVLPPEVALQPGDCFYRPEDHQMIANAFPGSMLQNTEYPNLVELSGIVPAKDVVLPASETGCKMVRPTT